jgi:hypothetical protein
MVKKYTCSGLSRGHSLTADKLEICDNIVQPVELLNVSSVFSVSAWPLRHVGTAGRWQVSTVTCAGD